jgi:lipid II:glycine glycyltransferase (peptidoglycan interpeptide bridge formation enzyme)
MKNIDPELWDLLIAPLPGVHILQTREWGAVKSAYGWSPNFYVWIEKEGQLLLADRPPQDPTQVVAAALLLQRSQTIGGVRLPARVLYSPKGPMLRDWGDVQLRQRVLQDLSHIAKRDGAIFIKIDPDVRIGVGIPGTDTSVEDQTGISVVDELRDSGWCLSSEQIQFQNTVLLDLKRPEESILAGMKQKARYNIRLAERKGVRVREGTVADIDVLYHMYIETADRDGFIIRDAGYYHKVWTTFIQADMAKPLIAEVGGIPIGAVIPFFFAHKAWYLYGMSTKMHREKMPNYLLQWEAICMAKRRDCYLYDLWGAPNAFTDDDPLMGVYRFKDGLGGEVVRHIGAWDLPVRPALYSLYTRTLPRLLDIMRQRGRRRIRQELGI